MSDPVCLSATQYAEFSDHDLYVFVDFTTVETMPTDDIHTHELVDDDWSLVRLSFSMLVNWCLGLHVSFITSIITTYICLSICIYIYIYVRHPQQCAGSLPWMARSLSVPVLSRFKSPFRWQASTRTEIPNVQFLHRGWQHVQLMEPPAAPDNLPNHMVWLVTAECMGTTTDFNYIMDKVRYCIATDIKRELSRCNGPIQWQVATIKDLHAITGSPDCTIYVLLSLQDTSKYILRFLERFTRAVLHKLIHQASLSYCNDGNSKVMVHDYVDMSSTDISDVIPGFVYYTILAVQALDMQSGLGP